MCGREFAWRRGITFKVRSRESYNAFYGARWAEQLLLRSTRRLGPLPHFDLLGSKRNGAYGRAPRGYHAAPLERSHLGGDAPLAKSAIKRWRRQRELAAEDGPTPAAGE
jgi:hypothetical protein